MCASLRVTQNPKAKRKQGMTGIWRSPFWCVSFFFSLSLSGESERSACLVWVEEFLELWRESG